MADRYGRYARPRSPLYNPARASLPINLTGHPLLATHEHYMHVIPTSRRENIPPRSGSSSTASTAGMVTTTYKIKADSPPRGSSVREGSRTRRSNTVDSNARPTIVTTVVAQRHRPVVHSGRPMSPLKNPYRSSEEEYYTIPASSKPGHTHQKRYSATMDNADLNRLATERETNRLKVAPGREGTTYTSTRARLLYPNAAVRHADTVADDYGDDGYGYTNPRDLVQEQPAQVRMPVPAPPSMRPIQRLAKVELPFDDQLIRRTSRPTSYHAESRRALRDDSYEVRDEEPRDRLHRQEPRYDGAVEQKGFGIRTERPERLERPDRPDAVKMVHTNLELDVQVPFWKRAYMKATDYKRKAIQVVLNGKVYFARPDSGSDRNIMTEAFAGDCGAKVQGGKDNTGLFKMGTGQCIQSIGRALVPLTLLTGEESEEHCWFHILPKCPMPLIMGAEFLRKIQLFTRNKHLLVECPSFGSFPTFKWIGSPQGELDFFANGQLLTGCADTGSDLDLISLDCALTYGFEIDKSYTSRTRVMLADESIVETVGQVHISSVQLPGFGDFEMSFHVLPNLICDVIFGEEFLEQMDAFNTCNIVDSTDHLSVYSLNPFINLGPMQSFLSRRSAKQKRDTSTIQQQHNSDIEAEIYRRNKADRLILKMKEECRVESAKIVEERRRRVFYLKHMGCIHCSGVPEPLEHQTEAIEEPSPVSVRIVS
jgi:hypothetical protein